MDDRYVGPKSLAFSLLLLALGGCQTLGTPLARLNPFSRSSATDGVAGTADAAADVLKPEQKANVQLELARGLERQGRTEEAQALYLDAAKAESRRAEAYHGLALLHDRKGECTQAEKYYRLALERAPQNAELHADCGYSAYLQQHWEDAEKSLRQALTLAPNLARAHNNLGLLLARTGRDSEALQEFIKAGSSEAEARANLALALTLSNRWTEAQSEYRAALALAPDLKAAQEGLRVVQAVAAKGSGTPPANAAAPSNWGVTQASYLAPATP